MSIQTMNTLIIFDLNGVLARRSRKNWIIPYEVDTFLERLSKFADIAIWTSTTRRNAEHAVKSLCIAPVFVWYREDTPMNSLVPHGTLKNLSLIKKNWKYSRYLIIDDSEDKIQFNDEREKISFQVNFDNPITSYTELYELILDKLSE